MSAAGQQKDKQNFDRKLEEEKLKCNSLLNSLNERAELVEKLEIELQEAKENLSSKSEWEMQLEQEKAKNKSLLTQLQTSALLVNCITR